MNDFQQSFLADSRRRDLLAEADRERLARMSGASPARSRSRSRSVMPRRPSRLRLLLGRAAG
jgi:hypothetical protein